MDEEGTFQGFSDFPYFDADNQGDQKFHRGVYRFEVRCLGVVPEKQHAIKAKWNGTTITNFTIRESVYGTK